jgi:hypothetical protein
LNKNYKFYRSKERRKGTMGFARANGQTGKSEE